MCCVACAVSLTSWLTFTGVPAWCAVCVVSLATWLLFSGVPARCVVLCLRCPWPLGSCSTVCPFGVLCVRCPGRLAHVCRRPRWMYFVLCPVSLATWLLLTGVLARCVVLRVRCPWSLGSRSPLCALGLLCCAFRILGHLAPVHRCARSLCCVACAVSVAPWLLFTRLPVWCVLCGVLRRVALLCVGCGSFVRPACSRTLRVFGVVCVPWGGCACLAPGPVPWLWPAACLTGVPRCPAMVRHVSSGPVPLGAPVRSLVAVVPSPTRGWRPRIYWAAARGTWRPAENPAHGACPWPPPRRGRWARSALYPFGVPRWDCPWRVPPVSVLSCVRCGGFACVDPVTDASGFSYRASLDEGLSRTTGAVLCGRLRAAFYSFLNCF